MKALVTGAAGFVGSNIAKRLLSDGYEVVGIDSLTDYYDPKIKYANLRTIESPQFEFIEADLNVVDLTSSLDGVDFVFHQAGQPGVRKSWGSDFRIYTDANINATQRLLEWAKTARNLKRFVYASSSSVYGEAESYPTLETHRPQPVSPYGVTKLAAEHLCSLYAANFAVPTVSLRYFTVYGPGQRPDMAFTRFVRSAVVGTAIEIYGDGNQVRDFTFVDDIVEANLKAAVVPSEPGSVFNVAGGSNVSVNEVLGILGQLNRIPLQVTYVQAVAGDVRRTAGSIDKISSILGWKPSIDLPTGLERHLSWGREYFG